MGGHRSWEVEFDLNSEGPAAVAGNPHITVPLAAVAGLPLGISLVGERWQDHRLAAIAQRLVRRIAEEGSVARR